jgi:Cu/Ag efflux protein CusF
MKTFSRCLTAFLVVCACSAAFTQQPSQDQGQQQPQRGWREFRGAFGAITEISGSTVKIKLADGSIGTVTTTSSTRFRKEQQDAKLSDFKVGDTIMVRGESTGERTWTAQMIGTAPSQSQMQERMKEAMGKTMVLGEVKSIDAPKLTIKRVDGVEQTIEADENTSFRRGRGESITLPDIKTGDTVMARGELKNGVFVPTNINVVDPEMARRMKEGGGMVFLGGGPGAHEERSQQGSNAQSSPQQSPPPQSPKQ